MLPFRPISVFRSEYTVSWISQSQVSTHRLQSSDTIMEETSEATTYVAPTGDLRLLVTHPKKGEADGTPSKDVTKTLVVSSTVMCLASPVWKAMFDPQGHFKEATWSTSAANREVAFPDDDPGALLVLLNISHLNFDQLPTTMEFDTLLNIAVLCDKYDMVKVIRPWIPKWAEPLRSHALERGHEEYAFIAWTFGDQVAFDVVIRRMVMKSLSSASGELLNGVGKPYGKVMPPGLLGELVKSLRGVGQRSWIHADTHEDSILGAREERLAKLLDLCYNLADEYASLGLPSSPPRFLCRAQKDREECDTYVLGSMIRGLRSLALLPSPIKVSSMNHYSVATFTGKLLAFECGFYASDSKNHYDCKYTIHFHKKVKIRNATTKPSGLLDSHRQHIEEQAKK